MSTHHEVSLKRMHPRLDKLRSERTGLEQAMEACSVPTATSHRRVGIGHDDCASEMANRLETEDRTKKSGGRFNHNNVLIERIEGRAVCNAWNHRTRSEFKMDGGVIHNGCNAAETRFF